MHLIDIIILFEEKVSVLAVVTVYSGIERLTNFFAVQNPNVNRQHGVESVGISRRVTFVVPHQKVDHVPSCGYAFVSPPAFFVIVVRGQESTLFLGVGLTVIFDEPGLLQSLKEFVFNEWKLCFELSLESAVTASDVSDFHCNVPVGAVLEGTLRLGFFAFLSVGDVGLLWGCSIFHWIFFICGVVRLESIYFYFITV